MWILPLTGFEQPTSGVGSNRATNWATYTAPSKNIFITCFVQHQWNFHFNLLSGPFLCCVDLAQVLIPSLLHLNRGRFNKTFSSTNYGIIIYGHILTINCHINWGKITIYNPFGRKLGMKKVLLNGPQKFKLHLLKCFYHSISERSLTSVWGTKTGLVIKEKVPSLFAYLGSFVLRPHSVWPVVGNKKLPKM